MVHYICNPTKVGLHETWHNNITLQKTCFNNMSAMNNMLEALHNYFFSPCLNINNIFLTSHALHVNRKNVLWEKR